MRLDIAQGRVAAMESYDIALVSDADSWIQPYVEELNARLCGSGHKVSRFYDFNRQRNYDMAFLLSYSRIVSSDELKRNRHNLVVHESALPRGKGWSPLTWQILEGKNRIPITLFEANEKVDAGRIYLQRELCFCGDELLAELHEAQGRATIELCEEFVARYPEVLLEARNQEGAESFYPRRTPKDSKIDMEQSLDAQFNLLRTVDNEKYPAYFERDGQKYILKIYKER